MPVSPTFRCFSPWCSSRNVWGWGALRELRWKLASRTLGQQKRKPSKLRPHFAQRSTTSCSEATHTKDGDQIANGQNRLTAGALGPENALNHNEDDPRERSAVPIRSLESTLQLSPGCCLRCSWNPPNINLCLVKSLYGFRHSAAQPWCSGPPEVGNSRNCIPH